MKTCSWCQTGTEFYPTQRQPCKECWLFANKVKRIFDGAADFKTEGCRDCGSLEPGYKGVRGYCKECWKARMKRYRATGVYETSKPKPKIKESTMANRRKFVKVPVDEFQTIIDTLLAAKETALPDDRLAFVADVVQKRWADHLVAVD